MRVDPAATRELVAAGSRAEDDRRLSLLLLVASAALAALFLIGAHAAGAADEASSITISAHDLASGDALGEFTFIVNEDNARYASDPFDQRPSIAGTESHSSLVASGDQSSANVTLPSGRYLISIRASDHKMWGKHITLPRDAGDVPISLRKYPLPLGKIKVFVFNDSHWTNGAPDEGEESLAGFHVTIEEQTNSQVSVDYNNEPLCGGDCVTDADGMVTLDNLGPATYFIYVTPPDGTDWVQTTTIDGGFGLQAGVEEGSDGLGAPGEQIWEAPPVPTGYWFGFVHASMDFPTPGEGAISGRALNWVGWPPFDVLVTDQNEPVANAYVAVSDSTTDTTVYVGQADSDGNFYIPNVPAGSYTLAIWDEQLSYIIRFINADVSPGQTVDLGEVGVSRWFGWLGGFVYQDIGVADDGTTLPDGSADNSVRDCIDSRDLSTCEPPLSNFPMDQRWRDGSTKENTITDGNGYYEYPTAEGGPLGKWIINEVGFPRFGTEPGASVHDEHDPLDLSKVQPIPTALGGGLLENQLLSEGHRSLVDWGKRPYADDEPGQIVGITYWATTRNEFDARFQATEGYEPGIPDVQVNLETSGPDGSPNTTDDVIVNEYVTDHWRQNKDCVFGDVNGSPIPFLNPLIGPNCLEVPINGVQSRDGAFDGGYAFADYCPNGFDESAPDPDNSPCWNEDHSDHMEPAPLVAGTYITHVIMPNGANGKPLYRIVMEEDVNVDLGAQFEPAIPPPPCTGDDHVVHIDPAVNPRSPMDGRTMPLCDKRLIELHNKQNANADFNLMTNFPNGKDVEVPGRIVGLVSDDIYFDGDPKSIWYGEPRPLPNIPIGIRDFTGRLIMTVKTDQNGSFEALLPSTETLNCPIPQGPCPGMYKVVVDDPGDKGHSNSNFNPNYLTAAFAWDVWPGQTDQLDVPLDPVSGTGCELATGTPELLQVSRPYVRRSSFGGDNTPTSRRITIQGDFLGSTPGAVTLTDSVRPGAPVRTLTPSGSPSLASGGIVSWNDRQIVVQIPATSGSFQPGPKQLLIRGSNGIVSPNGITIHVLGGGYSPTIVNVAPPTLNGHELQKAIDNASRGSLLVLSQGVYHENVILYKELKLQGLGPGGVVGARELQQRQPEDPRFNILGTTIDGRFFQDDLDYWNAKLASLTFGGNQAVSKGADITVVVRRGAWGHSREGEDDDDDDTLLDAARIDGLGVTMGNGSNGAGGLEVNAYARDLRVTNNIFESDAGLIGGAINLGVPYNGNQHNTNIQLKYNRVMGSGGLLRGGGLTIFNGAANYEVGNSIFCSNFSREYGAGISQWGNAPRGSIHDNQIYYNEAVDSGAGISIQGELPQPVDGVQQLSPGSGPVNIDRNLISSNMSGDDGGGIYVKSGRNARINIRNNMIVNNGAAHAGGGILLSDSTHVAIVNNTIADDFSTATWEGSDNQPRAAGLASEAHSDLFQATLPAGAKDFSDPAALFNNIFWNNLAYTLDRTTVPPTLVAGDFIDFGIIGTPGPRTFTPRYSLLTNGNVQQPDGSYQQVPGGQGNIVGQDPLFVAPFQPQLAVGPSRLDPQAPSVTIVTQDPPVGLTGNYHLQNGSPVIDRGVGFSNFPFPPAFALPNGSSILAPCGGTLGQSFPADIDRQHRPQLRSLRVLTPWDLGADEVPGVRAPVPWSCAGTTGTTG